LEWWRWAGGCMAGRGCGLARWPSGARLGAGRERGECCSCIPSLQADWRARVVEISIRNSSTGGVAKDGAGVEQRLRLSLDTCQLID